MVVYAKLCGVEILSSYIKEVSVGDMLTIQALVTNPLDWQHFYEKISTITPGGRTDFTVVTGEGDRLVGHGDVVEVDKWSDRGRYGFKIKIDVKKQKSLTDRRTRGPGKLKVPPLAAGKETPEKRAQEIAPVVAAATAATAATAAASAATTAVMTPSDLSNFRDMLKGSLAMDISK